MAIMFPYDTSYDPSAPVVEVTIRRATEVSLLALLDSGADCSIFPTNLLRRIGASYLETRNMINAGGHKQAVNLYRIEVQIGVYKIPGIRAIGINSNEAIIGRDVLNHLVLNHLVLNHLVLNHLVLNHLIVILDGETVRR